MKSFIKINLTLDGEDRDGFALGMGRVELLKNIDELGSLRKSAEHLGISYRSAWGKIKRAEEYLGIQLVEKHGSRRGGSKLTEEGKKLVIAFENVYASLMKFAEIEVDKHFAEFKKNVK